MGRRTPTSPPLLASWQLSLRGSTWWAKWSST